MSDRAVKRARHELPGTQVPPAWCRERFHEAASEIPAATFAQLVACGEVEGTDQRAERAFRSERLVR